MDSGGFCMTAGSSKRYSLAKLPNLMQSCCGRPPRPRSETSHRPETYYHSLDSVYTQLEGSMPPVRLLNSEWILARADALAAATTKADRAALALPRRQDLERNHPEAFLSLAEVRSLEVGAVGVCVAIGSVSHAWHSAHHPDPMGESLLQIAATLRTAQRAELQCQKAGSVDGPFGPTNFRRLPARCAIFYDWCSLFQARKAPSGKVLIARVPAEEAAFRRALREMQLWFAHKMLFAILLTLPPASRGIATDESGSEAGSEESTPYYERGWPTVECAWTMLAKASVVAISRSSSLLPGSSRCWPMIYDVGSSSGEAKRMPPMHPDTLAKLLATKRFTSPKADRPLVERLYRATLRSVLGGATVLAFPRSGWADDEMVELCNVLPLCKRCVRLELHANECGDVGAAALAAAAQRGALPRVETIYLEGNRVGDSGCATLTAAVRAGALPRLRELTVAGNPASFESKAELMRALGERTTTRRSGPRRPLIASVHALRASKRWRAPVASVEEAVVV